MKEGPPISAESATEHRLDGIEVGVIGGGPAGAMTALLLARAGVQVTIFEPRSPRRPDQTQGERTPFCTGCAGLIQENALMLLSSCGLTIPDAVIQSRLAGTEVHFPTRNDTVTLQTKSLTVFRGFSPIRQAPGTIVESFDAWLLNEAIAAGAMLREVPVDRIDFSDPKIPVIHTKDGMKHERRVVIGAFGHNRKLMEAIVYSPNQREQLEPPTTVRACIHEYHLGERVSAIGRYNHVFGNPTKQIWYAAIVPKGEYASVALMGRNDVLPADFHDFLALSAVQKLLGSDIAQKEVNCGCVSSITVRSPNRFILTDGREGVVMVNIGDAGPTQPRRNGIHAALHSGYLLAQTLITHGTSAEGLRRYEHTIRRTYVWDNTGAELTYEVFDFILNNPIPRDLVIAAARGAMPVVSTAMRHVMDYVLHGKGPYWQMPVRVLLDIL